MKTFKLTCLALTITGLCSCVDDGTDGSNGIDGSNALINQLPLEVGDANCRNGGLTVQSGIDSNSNGTLDTSEITQTEYVCNAAIDQLSANDILTNSNNSWYIQASNNVQQIESQLAQLKTERGSAKNVILFVGDGMGVSTVTAARIMEGQQKGLMGEENQLSFDTLPFAGLSKTYNVDAQTPDSAGTMVAMVSGVKTDIGVLGIDEDVERGDCASMAGNELVTALELAEIAGLSTGIVSTARITHATPAATYAKSPDRGWEDISDMPQDAIDAGCTDIADQLINFETNLEARYAGIDVDGIEVTFGGGRRHFLPKDAAFNSPDAQSSVEGDRTDGRDLTAEWQAQYPNGVFVYDQNGFDAINADSVERAFGLFNESHMQYEADRHNDISGEPSLSEMTAKAIDILDNNESGYFLMVEAGRIDHAHHAGNAYGALMDTIELSNAVRVAMQNTNPEETLIIVTADHGHVFTIGGYPKRGNPILGKVVKVGETEPALAADNLPYTTVAYANGRGFRDLGSETNSDATYATPAVAGRVDLTSVDTTAPGFHQEATVPLSSETHSGEDVPIFARGPLAQLVSGTNEQHMIFHIMDYAANLSGKANAALSQ